MALTRRQAIEFLASGAAAGTFWRDGLAAAVAGPAEPIANSTPEHAGAQTFERGAAIRTLLKDVAPETIDGPILFHEHLSIRYPLTKALAEAQGRPVPVSFSDDVDLMIAETRAAGADGVRCIVDGGHPDMDRDLDALKRIAAGSGVHIVASGGFYMQRNYPAEIASRSADQIADELVRDAAAQRLGAFGEIGQQGGVLSDDERKVFTAVARAQARTGLPIFTHNAYTGVRVANPPVPMDAALKQLDVLEAGGADVRHVAIGHVCCLDDPGANIARQLAKRGVFVGFDRVGINAIIPDEKRVAMILAFLEAGHVDHLLLSSDFSNGRGLKKNGGPGIALTVTTFAPMLAKAGVSEATLRQILVDNPRRFLAVAPKV
ncbi:MAG: phosphotriesterase family protein [Vicinamibacterales bacterium]